MSNPQLPAIIPNSNTLVPAADYTRSRPSSRPITPQYSLQQQPQQQLPHNYTAAAQASNATTTTTTTTTTVAPRPPLPSSTSYRDPFTVEPFAPRADLQYRVNPGPGPQNLQSQNQSLGVAPPPIYDNQKMVTYQLPDGYRSGGPPQEDGQRSPGYTGPGGVAAAAFAANYRAGNQEMGKRFLL